MNGHKFIPPAPADACDYRYPGAEVEMPCRLPLSHPVHKNSIPPAVLRAGRVEASNLQQLNDLQREKSDALSEMMGALPSDRSDLRDGKLGNITRYFVGRSLQLKRLEKDLEVAKQERADVVERLVAQEKITAALREEYRKATYMAEPDEETPEVTDVPDAFVQLSTEALDRFAEGYAEYGPGAADSQGLAGQWGDLYRKVMKLRPSMWVGKGRLTRETEEDILFDVIGHCLLALEMYARDFEGGRE